MKTCIHTTAHVFKFSVPHYYRPSTVSGFYGNMNMIRAFWSAYYGQMKKHSHVKVSSTVTIATCEHSIIPVGVGPSSLLGH